jgi:1-acyl-sn-glycerol-3-phosphate acyltransferase
MSDAFYNFLWYAGYPAFWVSSSPTVINAAVTRRDGPFILAANHRTAYDIPLLMRHCARNVDFISIVEVFRNPLVAWFYGSMNAFPLDRSKPDAPTMRVLLSRLEKGRAVGLFPEGQFRTEETSVLNGGPIKSGIGRIAQMMKVPIIPCAIHNSAAYKRFTSWLPFKHTQYGLNFGNPLEINPNLPEDIAYKDLEARLCNELRSLYAALMQKMK